MYEDAIMTEKEFEEKYKLYNKMLYSIIYGYTLNVDDAKDILQDVFIKYINMDKRFDSLDSEKYYLIRMTINMCNNYYRMNKSIIRTSNDYQDDKDSNYLLKRIIKELPQKYKEVIILYYYDSYDIKTIASILKLSESAVKKRLERARNKIKDELGDYYEA